ncbi:MAG TPA: hypothetical protein VH951_13770 [Dehalococcoidia bacterium]|jgi:hypothetical protein
MKALRGSDPGRLLVFALSLVVTAAVAIGAGYGLRSHNSAASTLRFPSEASQAATVRGVVQSVNADSITLQTESGPVTLKISPSTPREALQKIDLTAVHPGDWVNAGGVHHDQTIYALTALVVIPASDLEAPR